MAKLSSINKNERRKKLVVKFAAKITALKAQANDKSLDDTERLIARLKLAEVPRNANPPGSAIVAPPLAVLAAIIASLGFAASSCAISPTRG